MRYLTDNEIVVSNEIEWLPVIPENWKLCRLKDFATIETGIKNTENRIEEGIYPFFVRSQTVEYSDTFSFDGEAILTAGDGVGVAKVFHHYIGKFETHQRVYRICKFKRLNGRFLFYYISENLYKEVLKYNSKATVDSLRMPTFQRFPLLLPPLFEQIEIAKYLDAKTQAIDKKINLLTKKANNYKELRKSIIDNSVSRGLNTKAKFVSKEVGLTPLHWRIGRLKDISKSMSSGATPLTNISAYYENGIMNWVNTGDLNDGIINECQYKISETAIKDYPNLKVNKVGTLLIAMYGATICKIGLLNIEATTNQACCCINFKKDSYSKFVFYWVLANKNKILSLSIGGTQPNISQGIIAKLLIAIPPLEEQKAIANYLDENTKKIDAIVTNINKQIEALKEFRKVLITDVVTGRIKVIN
jgi:type I restriction enzyme, S subunit